MKQKINSNVFHVKSPTLSAETEKGILQRKVWRQQHGSIRSHKRIAPGHVFARNFSSVPQGENLDYASDDDVATRRRHNAGVEAAELTFGSKSKAVCMALER